MSRFSRLASLAFLLACSPVAAQQTSRVDDLEKRLTTLEAQVSAMAKELAELRRSVTVPAAGYAAEANPQETTVLAEVQKLGGTVARDPTSRAVISVDLKNTKVTDAELEHLQRLSSLQLLNLTYTKVTDTGLAHLAALTSLRTLNLDFTPTTDAGLAHVNPHYSRNPLRV
jgi:chaperonin cofactor prefoldin